MIAAAEGSASDEAGVGPTNISPPPTRGEARPMMMGNRPRCGTRRPVTTVDTVAVTQISDVRGDAVAERLRSGRVSLQSRPATPAPDVPAAADLTGALQSAARISTDLVDLVTEATTLTALAITNAILDARRADR